MFSLEGKNAKNIIKSNRCNSVLDLGQLNIPLNTWNEIQRLILSETIPHKQITKILLEKSNITPNDVDPNLLPICVF